MYKSKRRKKHLFLWTSFSGDENPRNLWFSTLKILLEEKEEEDYVQAKNSLK